MTTYLFPFAKVPKGNSIVLYGAGDCGRQFYKQIIATGYCSVVLWVDKAADELKQKMDLPVSQVGEIVKVLYDYCVIAISNSDIVNNVAAQLANDYNIPDFKFIREVHILPEPQLYNNQKEEYEYRLKNSDELLKIAPVEFVRYNRLDTMVRYLVCKDITNGIENKANLSLYSRMLLCRRSRREGTHYFQEKARFTTQDFIAEVRKICASMSANGFDKAHYIPMAGENHITLNGQHRAAVALAQEKDVWIRYYPNQKANDDFVFEWFLENKFNVNDQLRILRAFSDLYPSCGIIILYAPVEAHWDFIIAQILKELTVVGYADINS